MVSPGAELEKRLTESGMSRKELAQRINVSEKHICTVLNGNRGISSAFARKLGYVFADTTFWVNLQAIYDEEQMRAILDGIAQNIWQKMDARNLKLSALSDLSTVPTGVLSKIFNLC